MRKYERASARQKVHRKYYEKHAEELKEKRRIARESKKQNLPQQKD